MSSSTATPTDLTAAEQEQYDRDLAYAMQLQEQFQQEESQQQHGNSTHSAQQRDWKQIHNDEEYAKQLQTLLNNPDATYSTAEAPETSRYTEKLFSANDSLNEEELMRNYQEDLIEQSYYNFPLEEEDPEIIKYSRKNHNFDKEQKDRFSLSDHMKHQFPNTHFNKTVVDQLNHVQRLQEKTRVRKKDKKSRATKENVLDQRTLLLLFRMINNDEMQLLRMHGCVSTGKEANVYYGEAKDGSNLAVKVYKTSMLQFRDRDRYVAGEFRFRRGYSKSNARKMVEKWATKEFTNMHKMYRAGIPCPRPHDQVKHVFVMEFFGKEGWPARRLKDANLSKKKLLPVYRELVKIMRNIYQKAKLVHADLSEYNILYHKQKLHIIDVSQAVSNDHPNALEFLRSDCYNVSQFFIKRGLRQIMTIRELFDFIVSQTIPDESVDKYLDVALQKASERGDLDMELHTDDAVFKQAFIPRTLNQVMNFEQHFDSVKDGVENTDQLFYREVCGINMDLSGPQEVPDYLKVSSNDEEEDESPLTKEQEEEIERLSSEQEAIQAKEDALRKEADLVETDTESTEKDDEEDVDPKKELNQKQLALFEEFAKDIGKMLGSMERKERKQYVKEMKRQKRETKIPKAEKQRAKIVSKRRKGKKV